VKVYQNKTFDLKTSSIHTRNKKIL